MVSKHVSEGDKCFMCGEDNPNVLASHHIIPRCFGGSDGDINRVILCANHHQAIHAIYTEQVFHRLGVPKQTGEGDGSDGSIETRADFRSLQTEAQFEHLHEEISGGDLRQVFEDIYRVYLTDDEYRVQIIEGQGSNPKRDSTTQRERTRGIKEGLRTLMDVYDQKPGAPYSGLVGWGMAQGMSEVKARHEIEKLRDKGEVYEPQDGYLRTV